MKCDCTGIQLQPLGNGALFISCSYPGNHSPITPAIPVFVLWFTKYFSVSVHLKPPFLGQCHFSAEMSKIVVVLFWYVVAP